MGQRNKRKEAGTSGTWKSERIESAFEQYWRMNSDWILLYKKHAQVPIVMLRENSFSNLNRRTAKMRNQSPSSISGSIRILIPVRVIFEAGQVPCFGHFSLSNPFLSSFFSPSLTFFHPDSKASGVQGYRYIQLEKTYLDR